jgi:lysophospholipase L1-like esterase
VVAVGLAVGVASAAITPEPEPVASKVQDYYDKSVAGAKVTNAPDAKTVRYAAYGDSISEGNSPSFVDGKFGSLSWASYLGPGFTFAGGWADGGVKSATMLEHAKPVKADALVIIAGTNDYGNGVPFDESAANIAGIVQKVGAKRVLVSAVPPSDILPAEAAAFNTELKAFVASKGWGWVDSSAKLRTNDNAYVEGMTVDGTHPTEKAARIIGETIRAALLKS